MNCKYKVMSWQLNYDLCYVLKVCFCSVNMKKSTKFAKLYAHYVCVSIEQQRCRVTFKIIKHAWTGFMFFFSRFLRGKMTQVNFLISYMLCNGKLSIPLIT